MKRNLGHSMKPTRNASTLSEVTQTRAKRPWYNKTAVVAGKVSAQCEKGDHCHCFMLTCSCPKCHRKAI